MKRLTTRSENGSLTTDCDVCRSKDRCYDSTFCVSALTQRLAAIEDILGADYDLDSLRELVEAQKTGRLLALPCKVGTTVYVIGGKYRNGTVEKWCNTGLFRLSDLDKMGKTVFLTAEEADEALKTLEVTV